MTIGLRRSWSLVLVCITSRDPSFRDDGVTERLTFLFSWISIQILHWTFPFFLPFISNALLIPDHHQEEEKSKKMANPANPFCSRLFPPGTKITWPTGLHTNSLCQKLQGENLISDLGNIDRPKKLTSWLTPSRLSSRSSLPLRTPFSHLVCANIHLPSGPWCSPLCPDSSQSRVGATVAAFGPLVRTRGPGSGKCWATIKNCPERLSFILPCALGHAVQQASL